MVFCLFLFLCCCFVCCCFLFVCLFLFVFCFCCYESLFCFCLPFFFLFFFFGFFWGVSSENILTSLYTPQKMCRKRPAHGSIGYDRSPSGSCSWCDGSSDRSFMGDPLSYFSFQPVLRDWCNKGRGICYPVCGMIHIKEPLLLIEKSSLCGGSGFLLSLFVWFFTIRPTQYNRIKMC